MPPTRALVPIGSASASGQRAARGGHEQSRAGAIGSLSPSQSIASVPMTVASSGTPLPRRAPAMPTCSTAVAPPSATASSVAV